MRPRRYALRRAVLVLAAALVARAPVAAQQTTGTDSLSRAPAQRAGRPSYFYRGQPYGSDAYTGPADVLLNKGYNLSQALNRERRIFQARYGTRHLWESVSDPAGSIRNSGGWGNFFTEQILPVEAVTWIASGFDWDAAENMTWYPNYFGHLIEGGITSRRLAEKMRAQGVPFPSAVAGATTMAAAVINEMYTHPNLDHGTGGTVADLYVFDLGGVLLFSLDPVARFFAETLHAAVWSNQAALVLNPPVELTNASNNLVFKVPIPFVERASLFFRTAVGSHLGATFHMDDGLDLSIGGGADTSRQNIDPVTGRETVDIKQSASLYVDRDGNLLASLYWTQVDHRFLTLNVYPGVLHGALGGFLVVTRGDGIRLGLTHGALLGLGLGAAVGR